MRMGNRDGNYKDFVAHLRRQAALCVASVGLLP